VRGESAELRDDVAPPPLRRANSMDDLLRRD
jgi:hypothetical protein